jgi:L-fuconolactonase
MIDAHHHLWDPATRAYPWLDLPDLARIRHRFDVTDLRQCAARAGVDATVLVQTVPDVAETVNFLATAARNPDLIAGVVGWVDLAGPAVGRTLERLRDGRAGDRLVGIRHQVQDEADPGWLLRPAVLAGLGAVAASGLAYDLLVLPGQLPAAIGAVERVPECRFVLDHAAKPPIRSGLLQPWTRLLRRLAAFPNVACKLSGLVTEADWDRWTPQGIRPYAEEILIAFGAQRVLFGSDWPVCELAGGYQRVVELARDLCSGLDAGQRAAVFGGNARRWYNLAGPG